MSCADAVRWRAPGERRGDGALWDGRIELEATHVEATDHMVDVDCIDVCQRPCTRCTKERDVAIDGRVHGVDRVDKKGIHGARARRDDGQVCGRVREEPPSLAHLLVFCHPFLHKRFDEKMIDHKKGRRGNAEVEKMAEEGVVVEHDLRHVCSRDGDFL